MIVQSIAEKTVAEVLKESHASRADLVEIRLDALRHIPSSQSISAILGGCTKPVIMTFRPRVGVSDNERFRALSFAIQLGVPYVDVEDDAPYLSPILLHRSTTQIILSYHDCKKTPALRVLQKRLALMKKAGCNVIKIVTQAQKLSDTLIIRDLLQHHSSSFLVAFCMGEKGISSRILYRQFGSAWTYGCGRVPVAPGQIPVLEMIDVYRVRRIGKRTKVYGVVGNPVRYSKGKYLHNRLFLSHRLNAVYLPFLCDSVSEAAAFAKSLPVHGLSVTMPFKESMLSVCSTLSPESKRSGVVNTMIGKNKHFVGYNTDVVALLGRLQEEKLPDSFSVLVLGAGGAARASIVALLELDAMVSVLNRDSQKATLLARRFRCVVVSRVPKTHYDVVINATSVGMSPHDKISPLTPLQLRSLSPTLVVDWVHTPKMTHFMSIAKAQGIKVIGGMELFLLQAVEQYQLFVGKKISCETAEKCLE